MSRWGWLTLSRPESRQFAFRLERFSPLCGGVPTGGRGRRRGGHQLNGRRPRSSTSEVVCILFDKIDCLPFVWRECRPSAGILAVAAGASITEILPHLPPSGPYHGSVCGLGRPRPRLPPRRGSPSGVEPRPPVDAGALGPGRGLFSARQRAPCRSSVGLRLCINPSAFPLPWTPSLGGGADSEQKAGSTGSGLGG